MKLYQKIAQTFDAWHGRTHADNQTETMQEWAWKHEQNLEALIKEHMPSGSGFDSGTTLDLDASRPDRLVLSTAFHHMDEHGYYAGWTRHTVIVTPSLAHGFQLRVTGRDRRQIKDYIAETFHYNLGLEVLP